MHFHYRHAHTFIRTTVRDAYMEIFHTCTQYKMATLGSSNSKKRKKKKNSSFVSCIWLNNMKKWKVKQLVLNMTNVQGYLNKCCILWCIKQVSSLFFCHMCSPWGHKLLGCLQTSVESPSQPWWTTEGTNIMSWMSWNRHVEAETINWPLEKKHIHVILIGCSNQWVSSFIWQMIYFSFTIFCCIFYCTVKDCVSICSLFQVCLKRLLVCPYFQSIQTGMLFTV